MLVAQLAVLAAAPWNFLTTFLVLSTLSTLPYTEVSCARRAGRRDHTSLTYTASSHFAVGNFQVQTKMSSSVRDLSRTQLAATLVLGMVEMVLVEGS